MRKLFGFLLFSFTLWGSCLLVTPAFADDAAPEIGPPRPPPPPTAVAERKGAGWLLVVASVGCAIGAGYLLSTVKSSGGELSYAVSRGLMHIAGGSALAAGALGLSIGGIYLLATPPPAPDAGRSAR